METLVNGAGLLAGERISAPGLGNLEAGDLGRRRHHGPGGQSRAMPPRAKQLWRACPRSKRRLRRKPRIRSSWRDIARLTGISGGDGDSLHRLVMDLHKALNRLSASHAEEVLAGAHVYGLRPEDRSAVEAFMRGVEVDPQAEIRSSGSCDHRVASGARLTIQNDIGETDAHVVVIAVERGRGDGHLHRCSSGAREILHRPVPRIFPVQWSGLDRKSAEGLGDDGVFYLVTGRFRSRRRQEPRCLPRSGWRLAGLPDRLEQGPQGAA